MAASVRAVDVADEEFQEWLRGPRNVLLDEADWPEEVPKARIQCGSYGGWLEIVVKLLELGIVKPVRRKDVFRYRGQPVLNGALGVMKKGGLSWPESRAERRRKTKTTS